MVPSSSHSSVIELCTLEFKDHIRGSILYRLTTILASFAGLFYLSLYLAGKLHVLDTRGFVWKTFVVLVPTLGASLIAISRIEDARHHPFDVITGSLLGITCAFTSYRQYFPPLSEPWKKGRAYPIRTWGSPSEQDYNVAGRMIAAESSVEPLRSTLPPQGLPIELRPMHRMNTIPLGGDEEELGASQGVDLGSSNVFRQQVLQSDRMRHGNAPSQYVSARGRRGEDWDSVTSDEDDEDDEDHAPRQATPTAYQPARVHVPVELRDGA